jgi:hypothetical protein
MEHRKIISTDYKFKNEYNKFVTNQLSLNSDSIICNMHFSLTPLFSSFSHPYDEDYLNFYSIFFENKKDFDSLDIIYDDQRYESNKYFIDKNNILDVLKFVISTNNNIYLFGYDNNYYKSLNQFFLKERHLNKKNFLNELLQKNLVSHEQIEKYKNEELLFFSGIIGFVGHLKKSYKQYDKKIEINNVIHIKNFNVPKYYPIYETFVYDNNNNIDIYKHHITLFHNFLTETDLKKYGNNLEQIIPHFNQFNINYHAFFDNLLQSNQKIHNTFFSNISLNNEGLNFLSNMTEYKNDLLNLFLEKNVLKKSLTGNNLQKNLHILNQIFLKNDISKFPALLEKYPSLNNTHKSSLSHFIEEEKEFSYKMTLNCSELFLKFLPFEDINHQIIFAKFIYNSLKIYIENNHKNVNLHTDISLSQLKSIENIKNFNLYLTSNNESDLQSDTFKKFITKILNHSELSSFYKTPDFIEAFVRSIGLEINLDKNSFNKTHKAKAKI